MPYPQHCTPLVPLQRRPSPLTQRNSSALSRCLLDRVRVRPIPHVAADHGHRRRYGSEVGEVSVLVLHINHLHGPALGRICDLLRAQVWVPEVDQEPIDGIQHPCLRMVVVHGRDGIAMARPVDLVLVFDEQLIPQRSYGLSLLCLPSALTRDSPWGGRPCACEPTISTARREPSREAATALAGPG